MLKVLSAKAYLKQLKNRTNTSFFSLKEPVYEIIQNVIKNKDTALLDYARQFDKVEDIENFSIKCTRKEIQNALHSLSSDIKKIIDSAYENIYFYHNKEKAETWSFVKDDAFLGQLVLPIEKVGAYVPGGEGIYPSTVLMSCIPAKIAGVPHIYVASPPLPFKATLDPAIIYAGALCGVEEFYKIGGASAIAALAYGTQSVSKVYKIVGPGNLYVTTAKKMVYGDVDIDMLAGPSEIMIFADEESPVDYITYDIFSQSEHSKDASSIVLVPNKAMANKIIASVKEKIKLSKRAKTLEQALKNNGIIAIYSSIDEAYNIINEYAPEHLSILFNIDFATIARNIKNVGSIFMGTYTPEAVGDYFGGTNHALPTGGTAKFFSPLGVYDFQKRTSFTSYPKALLEKNRDKIIGFAEYEGFFEHANSVRVRCP